MPFSILFILLCLLHIHVEAAEVIERVSVIRSDNTQSLPSSPLAKSQKTAVLAPTDATVGDKLVLDAGKSGKYIISVLESRTTQFGNTIIHGQTPSGGASMLVVSDTGRITGDFYRYDGKVRVSTSEDRVITAWREGVDALPRAHDAGGVSPRQLGSKKANAQKNEIRHVEPSSADQHKTTLSQQKSSDVQFLYPRFSTGKQLISIFLYYDELIADATAVADYLLEITNKSFSDSGAQIEARIVGYESVAIDVYKTNGEILDMMEASETPFAAISGNRESTEADVTMTLRSAQADSGSYCGIARYGVYNGTHQRNWYEGVAEWRPQQSNSNWYCPENNFVHELGHLLGLAHERQSYEEDLLVGASSFAYAYRTETFSTVMNSNPSSLNIFSNPLLSCEGQTCGIPWTEANSADNTRALINTGPLIAANAGASFAPESISVGRILKNDWCGEEYGDGEFRGLFLRNNSDFDLQMHSSHYVRSDGSEQTYSRTDVTIEPSGYLGRGFCRGLDPENPVGSTYVSTYYRYVHPQSGEIIETLHVPWGEGFRNNHSVVRIAYSEGGQLYGHSERLIEAGDTTEIRFESDLGYELDEISGSCSGEWDGTTYSVGVTEDDCRVEATFKKIFGTFTVTPSADENGSVNITSAQVLQAGSSFSVTATPDPGYRIQLIVTDCDGVSSGNTYTIANVTKDCSIKFTFRESRFYNVTIKTFEGGGVDHEALSIEEDNAATILITPDYAYLIDEVTGSCGGSLTGTTYSTDPVTQDCNIVVSFKVDVGVRASDQFLKLLNFISKRIDNSG